MIKGYLLNRKEESEKREAESLVIKYWLFHSAQRILSTRLFIVYVCAWERESLRVLFRWFYLNISEYYLFGFCWMFLFYRQSIEPSNRV